MLKFSKHLKSIERSNYSSALKVVKLPTVVFVGDENAGKSSTLERFTMVDVLPRSNMICTRQPIILKLRHAEDISSERPDIRLKIPGQAERVGLTESEAREAMERHMEKLARAGKGIVFGEELEVEVRSDGVPTIDLIDLPGLVAVRVDGTEPDGIAEMTESCTRYYLDQVTTGVVVCVLDATMANQRTSRALRLVQDARPDLKGFTIGALAKADKTYDVSWEREGRRGPYWKLLNRLDGTAEDHVNIGSGGYVALVNRNTMEQNALPLEGHNKYEADWFSTMLKDLPPSEALTFSSQFGIDALVGKANQVMCEYLEKTYVPARMEQLVKEAAECTEQTNRLGIAPTELEISDLLDDVEKKLKLFLCPAAADEVCESAKRFWPSGKERGPSKCTRLVARHKLAEEFTRSLEGSSSVDHVVQGVTDVVRECFDFDTEGGYRLCRFSKLRDEVVETATNQVRTHAEEFRKEALKALQFHLQLSQGRSLDTEDICNALSDCLMWTLIAPVTAEPTGEFEWFKQIRKSTVTIPEEDCADRRAELEARLTDIREAHDMLQELF